MYSLNNYIKDIFIYIEETNIYLSMFHLNYIFQFSNTNQYSYIERYEFYNSFQMFFFFFFFFFFII
ncbi:hypothetical protein PFMC_03774 [Plasmodium falciparum CAMP/Malaysia]|uniref:Uncharacterized protein n=1 Tax=Plasmodium falciparum (isolate Camp / Malaysia) TaxID=5835 RepID=A0A024X552_PLAFC|nr:hypothetical protein PFMC_03774 [Plasmodium falciparum CAMP/Malaysia]